MNKSSVADPVVSVILSLYNPDLKYLAEQLDSIAAQDFDDFEVVVYNDNPNGDDLSAFCQDHLGKKALRYFATKKNRGYVKAFEHLVSLANGRCLAFCDQDDLWAPSRLSAGVKALNSGALLVTCDRKIISADDRILCESWRHSHPTFPETSWNTGDCITAQAVFTCYSIGMATMIRSDIAKALRPFPACTGHDKWLVLGASALGTCAFIDSPLVSYRRHETNMTGSLSRISCKQDWYNTRCADALELAQTFALRFPSYPDVARIIDFARARVEHNVWSIYRNRDLAPAIARFEIALHFTPNWLFKLALQIKTNLLSG